MTKEFGYNKSVDFCEVHFWGILSDVYGFTCAIFSYKLYRDLSTFSNLACISGALDLTFYKFCCLGSVFA